MGDKFGSPLKFDVLSRGHVRVFFSPALVFGFEGQVETLLEML